MTAATPANPRKSAKFGQVNSAASSPFALAFHLVMNKVGANLKDDLISRLKEQGLAFGPDNSPEMSLAQLDAGLKKILGSGSALIIKYIEAEIERLT